MRFYYNVHVVSVGCFHVPRPKIFGIHQVKTKYKIVEKYKFKDKVWEIVFFNWNTLFAPQFRNTNISHEPF